MLHSLVDSADDVKSILEYSKTPINIWNFNIYFLPLHRNSTECPDGGIGRRAGLKHQWSKIHPGSTPGLGTSNPW